MTTDQVPTINAANPAEQLRTTFAASRVGFRWFGTTKSLTQQQKNQAADSFGAEAEFLSAGKRLLDTKHPVYRELSSVRSRANSYWRGESLPYPQPAIRLIRQDRIDRFDERMREFQDELAEAVGNLNREYTALKDTARLQLGSLYCDADYPDSLHELFQVHWDFPSVEPPNYLQQLNPALYEQEANRVAQRFDQALELAEDAFMEELNSLVTHLNERLTGQQDGKPKVFRDSAITNLSEFFDRFRSLNVRSNSELEQIVKHCQQLISGCNPQSLRNNRLIRDSVAAELSNVNLNLDRLLVDRPRRNIIRKAG